jgi:hypothetical protein
MPMSPKGPVMNKVMNKAFSYRGRIAAIAVPLLLVSSGMLYGQIEGPKRGIAPIASTGDFEVAGVEVNTTGDSAQEARQKGWEEAQRKAWSALWVRTHGGAGSSLADSTLDGLVSAIVVEQEQIGPHRYVAKLGVVFDRARAGQLLGVKGITARSAPLLVIPVYWTAGAPMVFEKQNLWQRSWAKFRTADSRIDYVRPSGSGGESLLLNAGQLDRRSRSWWRVILDQFGAADVLIPIVRIERQWPGGPIVGNFSARYGPDNRFLGSFTLSAENTAGLPAMMDAGVKKMDELFQNALSAGRLRADVSLVLEKEIVEEEALETPAEAVVTTPQNSSDDGQAVTTEPAVPVDPLESAVQEVIKENPEAAGAKPDAPKPAKPPKLDVERTIGYNDVRDSKLRRYRSKPSARL